LDKPEAHSSLRAGSGNGVLTHALQPECLLSKAEVDELVAQWKATQAKILSEPEDKPWKLREFMAADLSGATCKGTTRRTLSVRESLL